MSYNLTNNQLQIVELLKVCLNKSNNNIKYGLVYLKNSDKSKLILGADNNSFTGEGFYIVKMCKDGLTIIYPRLNGNTVNALMTRKVITNTGKGFYILNTSFFQNIEKPTEKEKTLKHLENLKRKFENREYKGFKERASLVREIKRIEYSLEGRDYDKEMELEKKANDERLRKIEEEDKKSKELAIELSKKEELPMPKGSDYVYYDKPFSRIKTNAYRGEFKENKGTGSNTGTAMYGQGIYTTTNKAYAKKFGEVREVTIDELPVVPLRFNNQNDFNQFEYILSESLGIKKTDLHLVGDINEIICKLGYDGATIGSGKDMIIVKYFKK